MRVRLLQPVGSLGAMNADVGHHALADEPLAHEGTDQRNMLLQGQFAREGNLHLAAELGIDPFLRPFHDVPEGLAGEHPFRRPRRGHDLGMDHVRFVELEPLTLRDIEQPLSRAIGSRSHGGSAGRAARPGSSAKTSPQDLQSEVIDRHLNTP